MILKRFQNTIYFLVVVVLLLFFVVGILPISILKYKNNGLIFLLPFKKKNHH